MRGKRAGYVVTGGPGSGEPSVRRMVLAAGLGGLAAGGGGWAFDGFRQDSLLKAALFGIAMAAVYFASRLVERHRRG